MRAIHLFIAFLLVSIAVSAQSFDVLESNVTKVIDPANTETVSFTINNTGSTNLSSFTFDTSALDLVDNDGDAITLSFSNPETVTAGTSKTVTITIDSSSTLDFETYGGKVTVSSGSLTDSFDLNLESQPTVCDSGIQGNDLVLKIDDPNRNDDFKPGDIIRVKANVKNVGKKSIDVQVEAFLFDEDTKIASVTSDTTNVNDGDNEDFIMELEIPTDNRDLKENKDFNLILKAFDDDHESSNCAQSSLPLKFKLNNDDLVIDDSISKFDPSAVSCGQLATATVIITNIGDDKQEDVTLTVSNARLNIKEKSAPFDLDKFDSDEDNEITKRINIAIPKDVFKGDYIFDAVVDYSGKRATLPLKLSVLSCQKELPFVSVGNADFKVLSNLFTVEQGDLITIPVKITNHEDQGLFNVNFVNFEDFAEPVSAKTATLTKDQSSTVFLNLRVQDDAVPGRYSVTVNLDSGSKTIASDTVTVDVKKKVEPSFSFTQLPGNFWLALDILIAIILITFILVMIIRKK